MTFARRLAKIEAALGGACEPVSVTRIVFTEAKREDGGTTAMVEAAMIRRPDGWETIQREAGETEAAFLDRINHWNGAMPF